MRHAPLALMALLLLGLASPLRALQGIVYVDADGDGVRGPGELPLAGVVVSNGLEVVKSDASGSWSLADGPDGFVRVTCPDDYRCARWYLEGSGDFALVPAPSDDEFFFVQVSDIHAYDEAADFLAWSRPAIPSWLPDFVVNWLVLYQLGRGYPHLSREQIAQAFRQEVERYRVGEELSDADAIAAYSEEFARPDSPLGRVASMVRSALAEIAALEPSFVVDTGDLVLEGNQAPASVVERWFRFYDASTRATGVPWVRTIGNNEIAGTRNDDFPSDDPRFGKHFFRSHYGPTWFSFDRGPFHFVALDTHRPDPEDDDPKAWRFDLMPDAERAWLEADLAAHEGRVVVALNHEPFTIDPGWPFADRLDPARDEGLFERFAVAYTLTGHVHVNGLQHEGPTTHIITGALSGMRWIVPSTVHPRGYRLYYAREGRLYSAWKRLGEPVLGLVVPPLSPDIAPAAGPGAGPDVVGVAADASGPFAEVSLSVDGHELLVERWGDYFFAARTPSGGLAEGARVELRARSRSGVTDKLRFTVGAAQGERP